MAGYMFPPMCYIPKSKEAHSVREKVTYNQISSNSLWAATSKQLQSNLHEKMIITAIFQGMACDWNNSGANPSRGRRSPWIQRLVPGQMSMTVALMIITVALMIITVAWLITISTLNMNHELHPLLRNPDFPFSTART